MTYAFIFLLSSSSSCPLHSPEYFLDYLNDLNKICAKETLLAKKKNEGLLPHFFTGSKSEKSLKVQMICSLFNIMVIYFYGHSLLLLTLNYRYIPGFISHCSVIFNNMVFQISKSSSILHQSKMYVTSTSCYTGQRQ